MTTEARQAAVGVSPTDLQLRHIGRRNSGQEYDHYVDEDVDSAIVDDCCERPDAGHGHQGQQQAKEEGQFAA